MSPAPTGFGGNPARWLRTFFSVRQRVRRIVVSAPPSVLLQWKEELDQRFGLTFVVFDRDYVRRMRQERGFSVNPWATHSRFIVSHRLLRDPDYKVLLDDWLGAFAAGSLGNQLLAIMQCAERGIAPGPIATFMGWKDKGRHVRKGEHAIVLCMPITSKRKAEGQSVSDDGKPEIFTRFVFRPNWFVLAQTEGKDVEPAAIPDWDRARAHETLGVTEEPFSMTDGNCQGYPRGNVSGSVGRYIYSTPQSPGFGRAVPSLTRPGQSTKATDRARLRSGWPHSTHAPP